MLDQMRSVDIMERLRQESVLDAVKRRQDRWKSRLEEMNNERKTLLERWRERDQEEDHVQDGMRINNFTIV